uniref:Aminotransferase class V domain-containing protein n=1 Tax=Alexandrium monilatum TaxID=311494 RepID=A0A7S4RBV9_9DINO
MTRARYVFEGSAEAQAPASAEAAAALQEADWEEVCRALREGVLGGETETSTPFGSRRIVYADHTATGRSLDALERQVQEHVLPLYGNVHSLTTATARQSTQFRAEARQLVKQYYNLDASHAAIFCGAGTTAAVHRFVQMLENAGWDLGVADGAGAEPTARLEDRWGSIECRLCGVRLKGEAAFRAHCATEAHRVAEAKASAGMKVADGRADPCPAPAVPGRDTCSPPRRIVVLADPTAHHSLTLPFREAAARSAVVLAATDTTGCSVASVADGGGKTTADDAAGPGAPPACRGSAHRAVSVVDLAFGPGQGPCLRDLEERLVEVAAEGALALCLLSAASNVTGGVQDVASVTELVHRAGGLACWDLAGLSGHRRPDLAPSGHPLAHVDAAFASPHKFLGGPSTCGLLLVRKALLRNPVPAVPGGGSVFFVGPGWHSYISNTEEREEAGSPDLAACARTGLCFHLHASLPRGLVEGREATQLRALLGALAASPRVEVLAPEACAGGTGTVSFLVRYMEGGLYLHHSFVSCLLNDLFGVQSRAGCACAGPHAQHLLGIDAAMAADFDRALAQDACEIVRPGFSRVSVHFVDSDEHAEVVRTAICWVAEHGWKLLPHYTFDVVTGEWSHRHDARRSARDWLSEWRPLGPGRAAKAPGAGPAAGASAAGDLLELVASVALHDAGSWLPCASSSDVGADAEGVSTGAARAVTA